MQAILSRTVLSAYRVLDLCDHRGQMAGFILASLGAEVIAVEPPEGSRARRVGPFAGDVSLSWWAWNRGKKSVIAVVGSPEFDELLASADVVIEPGDLGLHYENLAALNPGLVQVTITAFGSDGPKASWPASDLTINASACQLALNGDSDRPPVRTSVPQAWLHAGAEAACGALVAISERAVSGRGQHVDVSAQQATMQAALPGTLQSPNGSPDLGRTAGGILAGPLRLQFVYPASDGHVSITVLFGDTIGPYTRRLMEWVAEEGFCDESLRDTDWVEFANNLVAGREPVSKILELTAAVTSFTRCYSKAELFEEAKRRKLLLVPVMTPGELVGSAHWAERGYFDVIDDPSLNGAVICPGPFAKFSATPLKTLGPAPTLGADQIEPHVATGHRPVASSPERALAGLKVLDMTWVYAGPLATRLLADFGATVVKVEAQVRPDASRGGGPQLGGGLGPEDSGQYAHFNAGKLGFSLDLSVAESRPVLQDLVRWADVLIESYTPGVMASWGCSYEELSAINPRLVMLSTCLMGQTGPMNTFAGFGNLAGAVTGFYELTGWADRSPAGPFLAYTDYVAPRFMLCSILAALDWRRQSGKGQFIDFSQAESSIHFMSPAVLEWTVAGRAVTRAGNADPQWAPHGVYPCSGDDKWVAIVCETDAQWWALHRVAAFPAELKGLSATDRLDRQAQLDQLLAEWTQNQTTAGVEGALVAAGVPVHGVQNSAACAADPQLLHRHHFRTVPHPVHGTSVVEGPRERLSRTPAHVARAGPMLGEHNSEVLSGLLGYNDDAITALVIAGALG